jgi:hypothetical protein
VAIRATTVSAPPVRKVGPGPTVCHSPPAMRFQIRRAIPLAQLTIFENTNAFLNIRPSAISRTFTVAVLLQEILQEWQFY